MNNAWTRALGDPETFIAEIPRLTEQCQQRLKVDSVTLRVLREFALNGEGGTSGDPQMMREMMGAFAAFINAYYGYQIKRSWWARLFGWQLVATNGRDRCDFFDLFYRMVFEGLDLAPEDEGLATPG